MLLISLFASLNVFALSEVILLGSLLQAINLDKQRRNDDVDKSGVTSKCTARLTEHVKIHTYDFTGPSLDLINNGPAKSSPMSTNARVSATRPFGKSGFRGTL